MARFTIVFLGLAMFLGACGGGGYGGGGDGGYGDAPPVTNQAIGGAWVGTDGNGLEILGLSTETGRMHWLAPATGEQGFGTGTVSGSNVTINYTYVAPFGYTLADGSTFATCTATGTIQQRQSLAVTISCSTGNGGSFNNSATLAYDSLYDRDSSLATIAGNYDDFGNVLNVSSSGVIFEQIPATGCVVNGQVSIIDSRYNSYDVSITYSSCAGANAILNGATFTGLGILDNTVSPEQAIVGMTGDVGGVTFSIIYIVSRI